MAASHQLSLTSLASNCNIVAAGDKFNNNSNSHKDPGSAPQTLHRQPDNGRRKSFLLSRIFSKPKDQDDDSGTEDNSAPTEKEELSVSETKKVRQNKQTTEEQSHCIEKTSEKLFLVLLSIFKLHITLILNTPYVGFFMLCNAGLAGQTVHLNLMVESVSLY